jgi:hypothetical protein
MMPVLGNFASALALQELSAALGALDAPFDKLPDVKNKDGESITDVKEKRLAIVRQHVQAAGDIINLDEQVKTQGQMALQAALLAKYKDVIKASLKAKGAPQQVLDALDNPALLPPGLDFNEDGEECNCPSCQARRAATEKKDEPFGFAAGIERMRKEKEKAQAEKK